MRMDAVWKLSGCELKQIKPGWKKGTETFLVDVCGPERAEVERSLSAALDVMPTNSRALSDTCSGSASSALACSFSCVGSKVRSESGPAGSQWSGRGGGRTWDTEWKFSFVFCGCVEVSEGRSKVHVQQSRKCYELKSLFMTSDIHLDWRFTWLRSKVQRSRLLWCHKSLCGPWLNNNWI